MRPMPILLIAVLAVALVGLGSFAAAQTPPNAGSWPGWHSHWPGFWWICPLILLFTIAFFVVISFALRRNRGEGRPPWRWMSEQLEGQRLYEGYQGAAPETAVDILNRRYARGEIDKAEYDEKKAAISGDSRDGDIR